MADRVKPNAVCRGCGRPLEKTARGSDQWDVYCSSCRIRLAEQHIPGGVTVFKTPSKKSQTKIIVKWILLIGCSVLIAVNSVVVVRLLAREKPKEFVPPNISKDAILCLSNLEEISELLQEGQLPPDSIVCPVSGEPYRVQIEEGDTIVSCPNPESHLLYGLQVSKKNPVPKVVR